MTVYVLTVVDFTLNEIGACQWNPRVFKDCGTMLEKAYEMYQEEHEQLTENEAIEEDGYEEALDFVDFANDMEDSCVDIHTIDGAIRFTYYKLDVE